MLTLLIAVIPTAMSPTDKHTRGDSPGTARQYFQNQPRQF